MSALIAMGVMGASAALLALPLVPALRELHRRADAAPLKTRTDDGEIRNFASAFREVVQKVSPTLDELAGDARGPLTLPDGSAARVLPAGAHAWQESDVDTVVLCAGDAHVPAGMRFLRELYVHGKLAAAEGAVFRAALVEGDAQLGRSCAVLRWLHVGGALSAASGCQLYGRLSADHSIELAPGCRFERVNAPVVIIGAQGIPTPLRRPAVHNEGSIIDRRLGRLRTTSELHLAAGDLLQGHMISTRAVRLDPGVQVTGSIKSHGPASIGDNGQLHGAIACSSDLQVGRGCFVRGPVMCEGELVIGAGTQIGSPDCPTSISATRIRIAPGTVLYGSMWAREFGVVEP